MKFSEMDSVLASKLAGKRVQPSMGGDPEFFVSNRRGKILNADAFFPSKYEPLTNGDNKVFFDGIQAEMAFHYSTCRDDVLGNIRRCFKLAKTKMPHDHGFTLKPASKIDKKIIEGADPEARIFGCAPDFNAYTRSVNTTEMDASRHPFRYAGGHIHLGASSKYLKEGDNEYELVHRPENHLRIIKFLDLMVSIPTLILDNGVGSKQRRDKYGKAGCFRPTPYGIEYRTPSCWWLKSPMTTSLMFGFAKLAWTLLVCNLDEEFRKAIEPDEEVPRGIIDESDTKSSLKLWKRMRPYLAIAGKANTNPMNIRSVKVKGDSLFIAPSGKDIAKNMLKTKGTPVFPLAVFEYAIDNGLEALVSDQVGDEWVLNGTEFYESRGFVNGSFFRFRNDEKFLKFQDSLLKELY